MTDLAEALRFYKDKAVEQWIDYTLSTYASSTFFRKEGDKFANPVGGTIRDALKTLFELIQKGRDSKEFVAPLDAIMRIRAVQEFSPSQAVSPIHAIKHILRDLLAADKERQQFVSELYDIEFAIDVAVLAAFDIYMECREKLYEVRIAEIKSGRNILTDSKCPSTLLNDNLQESTK